MGWYQYAKGAYNEHRLAKIVSQFSDHVYLNLRLPTKLTNRGYTELDVVAIVGSTLVIFETKSAKSIEGEYKSRYWKMTSTSNTFNVLNIVVQNKLHSRVCSDIYYKTYGSYCSIVSIVTVPDETNLYGDVSEHIIPFSRIGEVLLGINLATDNIVVDRLIAILEEVNNL